MQITLPRTYADRTYAMSYRVGPRLTARVVWQGSSDVVNVTFWEPGVPGYVVPDDFPAAADERCAFSGVCREITEAYLASRNARATSAFPHPVRG